jgi:hypothetical protein
MNHLSRKSAPGVFQLRKRKIPEVKQYNVDNSGDNYFFDLDIDRAFIDARSTLKGKSVEEVFRAGFMGGYRYLQETVDIGTNSIRQSCGLKV